MRKKLMLLVCLLVFLAGCSVVNLASIQMPGTHINTLKSFYVIKLEGEKHDIDRLIAQQLTAMGFKAGSGPESAVPEGTDAVVTYADRWMWDLANYLIQLTIHIKTVDNDFVMGAGKSFRTSLDRKPPEFMVKEVLDDIFKRTGDQAG